MDKPTICMECKWVRHIIWYDCLRDPVSEDYICDGGWLKGEACANKNRDGHCPDFKEKTTSQPPAGGEEKSR